MNPFGHSFFYWRRGTRGIVPIKWQNPKKMLRLICLSSVERPYLSSSSFTVIAIQCYGVLLPYQLNPLKNRCSLLQVATTGSNWPKLLSTHPRPSLSSAAKPVRNLFYFSKVEGHLQRIPENLTIGQKVFFFIFHFLFPASKAAAVVEEDIIKL
jgi:hypothetical protein